MPAISLSDAARLANVNPSTITRAVKTGRLSVRVLDNGRKAIDPVELERVFPSDRPQPCAARQDKQEMHDHANDQLLRKMEDEIGFLRQQMCNLERDKEDLRSRLDKAEQERGVALRLLENQRQPRSWLPWRRVA